MSHRRHENDHSQSQVEGKFWHRNRKIKPSKWKTMIQIPSLKPTVLRLRSILVTTINSHGSRRSIFSFLDVLFCVFGGFLFLFETEILLSIAEGKLLQESQRRKKPLALEDEVAHVLAHLSPFSQ